MPRARLLLLAALLVPPGLLVSQQARGAGLCVFDGRSYSEGARICAEPGLLMTCSVSGDRAIWTVATDKDLSGVCSPSSRRGDARMELRRAGRGDGAEPSAPAESAPKCFTFSGKRYCE